MMRRMLVFLILLGCESNRWGFVDGAAVDAPWRWSDSEVECYRALAETRNRERREHGTADVFAIYCVEGKWLR